MEFSLSSYCCNSLVVLLTLPAVILPLLPSSPHPSWSNFTKILFSKMPVWKGEKKSELTTQQLSFHGGKTKLTSRAGVIQTAILSHCKNKTSFGRASVPIVGWLLMIKGCIFLHPKSLYKRVLQRAFVLTLNRRWLLPELSAYWLKLFGTFLNQKSFSSSFPGNFNFHSHTDIL